MMTVHPVAFPLVNATVRFVELPAQIVASPESVATGTVHTACASVLEILPFVPKSPLYTARIECAPTLNDAVENVETPVESAVPVPKSVFPSKNRTTPPFGGFAPVPVLATVAVNVTLSPNPDELGPVKPVVVWSMSVAVGFAAPATPGSSVKTFEKFVPDTVPCVETCMTGAGVGMLGVGNGLFTVASNRTVTLFPAGNVTAVPNVTVSPAFGPNWGREENDE